MKKIRCSLCLSLIMFTGLFSTTINADVIERSIIVDISNDIIQDTYDSAGNPGKGVRINQDITPFNLDTGDLIKTWLNFTNPIFIQQVPGSDYKAYPPTDSFGMEPISVLYWYSPGQNSSYSTVYTGELDVSDGYPEWTVLESFSSGGGSGFTAFNNSLFTPKGNLTDSYFILNGIYIETEITQINSGIIVDQCSFILNASDFYVIPEPATLLLVGIGAVMMRRRK